MAKVSKKVERLARGLCMASQFEFGILETLGRDVLLMRIETRWPMYLEEAVLLNQCLNLVKDDVLDGDTEWVLTEEEYNSLGDDDDSEE